MKKQFNRILCFVLCLAMLVPMLAACGSKEDENQGPVIYLDQDVIRVSSEVDSVTMTLTLSGASWKEVTAESLTLSGAFENMTVASAGVVDDQLNISLSGKPVIDSGLGVYVSGGVSVSPDAIDAELTDPITAYVAIDSVNVYADYTKLAVSGGKLTLPILLSSDTWTDKATAAAFAVDGMTVSDATKTDDATVTLTLDTDAADANAAAALLNGKTVTVKAEAVSSGNAYEMNLSTGGATFYPVFDYVELTGNDLSFTLILQAKSGTFAGDLAVSDVSFADGFAGATDARLTRDNDNEATLTFRIPANGQTVETLKVNGTVNLRDGAMLNLWGAAQSESTYTKIYEQSGIGKDLSTIDLALIESHVDKIINTPASQVLSGISGIASAGQAIYSILQVTGVMESEMSILRELRQEMTELRSDVRDIKNGIAMVNATLDKNHAQGIVSDFRKDILSKFDETNSTYADFVAMLNRYVASHPEYFVPKYGTETLPVTPDDDDPIVDPGFTFLPDFTYEIKLEDLDTTKLMQFAALMVKENAVLFNEIRTLSNALMKTMIDRDMKVGASDPIAAFDDLMAATYNYDKQTYDKRMAFRAEILAALDNANLMLCFLQLGEAGMTMPDEPNAEYEKVIKRIATDLESNYNKARNSVQKSKPTEPVFYSYTFGCQTLGSFFGTFDGRWNDVDPATHLSSLPDGTAAIYAQKLHGKTIREELAECGFDMADLEKELNDARVPIAAKLAFTVNGLVDSYDPCEVHVYVLDMDTRNPTPEYYETFRNESYFFGVVVDNKTKRQVISIIPYLY